MTSIFFNHVCVHACSIMSNSVLPMEYSLPYSSVQEFPRQEYWSGLPFPTLGDFPTQGLNPHLSHWQAYSLPLVASGELFWIILESIGVPFFFSPKTRQIMLYPLLLTVLCLCFCISLGVASGATLRLKRAGFALQRLLLLRSTGSRAQGCQ